MERGSVCSLVFLYPKRHSNSAPPHLFAFLMSCSLLLCSPPPFSSCDRSFFFSLLTTVLNKSRTEGDIVDIVSPSLTAVASEGLEVIPEQPDQIPDLSGPLLRRDDNLRWHRSFCRFSPAEKSLQVYESPEETQYLYALQLDSAKINFNPEGCDREHSFAITLPIPDPQPPITIVTPDHSRQDRYFAAYSEVDYRHWKTTLEYLLYMPHRPRLLNGTDFVKDGFTPGSGETPGSGDKNGHFPPPPPGTVCVCVSVCVCMCLCLCVCVHCI